MNYSCRYNIRSNHMTLVDANIALVKRLVSVKFHFQSERDAIFWNFKFVRQLINFRARCFERWERQIVTDLKLAAAPIDERYIQHVTSPGLHNRSRQQRKFWKLHDAATFLVSSR